jgi:hypothetical protein
MKNEDRMWSMIVPWPKGTPIANMTSGEPMPAKEVGNYKVGHQRKNTPRLKGAWQCTSCEAWYS